MSYAKNAQQILLQFHPSNNNHYQPQVNHIYNKQGKRMSIDDLIKKDPNIWIPSVSNELGRMTNGIRSIKGNNVLVFVPKSSIPHGSKITYGNMVCDYRPKKEDPYRTRLTVGGDRLDFDGNPSSPAASLLETKILINSIISDARDGAKFLSLDLKDHFLQSYLVHPQYMRIHGRYFFKEIHDKYNIDNIICTDGYVYCKIIKGMYGLKEAAMLAREKIIKVLAPHGYQPSKFAPNIWTHHTRRTKFCLCVDDFGVKYYSKADADHLIQALQQVYDLTVDFDGKEYCDLTLNSNYQAQYVDVSMPQFVTKSLQKLQHPKPSKPQHAPHRHIQPIYGQQQQ